MKTLMIVLVAAMGCLNLSEIRAEEKVIKTHALSLHGEPKYKQGFSHFDYVNPDAPKGGEVRMHSIGTYDTLNPFTLKGVSAAGAGSIYDSLMVDSGDEPYTEYGLLAESVEIPEDLSWAVFTLRKEARWHDGRPITVEDVIFSFNILKTKGHPQYRFYYANVDRAEKAGERRVKFVFSGDVNRELPHIIGQLAIIPKHYWQGRDFEKTTLDPPLGSGPYKIAAFDPGRSITIVRVKDYWGEDLPVNRGRNNFGTIRYDYYRDGTVALEALKAGEYDFRRENISKSWATAYDIPAVKAGLLRKEEIPHKQPQGLQGYVFNIRRPIFKDPLVRRAIAYAFDFEWSNKNLFYGQYVRTQSYFSNSELASEGLPSPEELQILEPLRGKIPKEVFTEAYQPPTTDGSGRIRSHLKTAMVLLKKAGWVIKKGKLVHGETNRSLSFEILHFSPSWERISLPFKKNLSRLGIEADVRVVDTAQYIKRTENFDFDMTVQVFAQSSSPGNEQRDFWGSAAADKPGSRNTIGIKDPAVDSLVDLIISAPDRESLIHRTRALDRVLLWGHYVVPNWHIKHFRVAFWDKFGRPKVNPYYSLPFSAWWVDAKKAARLKERRAALKK